MRRWLCVGLVVLHASSARAESDPLALGRAVARRFSPSQEAKVTALLQQLQTAQQDVDDALLLAAMALESNPVRGAGVDLSATAGAGFDVDRAGADVSVLASAHVDGDRCSLARADLLVRGRTSTSVDDRARASVDGSASLCLPEGLDLSGLPEAEGLAFSIFPLRGRAFGALNKTPALTASRAVTPEPYSEVGFGVWMEGMRYLRHGGTYYWAFPGVMIEQRYHWRGFPAGEASRQEIVVDAYFVRLGHRRPSTALADRTIDIFGFGAHGVQDATGTAVAEFWPLRIAGFGPGTEKVLLDATVGVSATGTLTSEDTVITSSEVPDKTILYVHAGIAAGSPRTGVGATYDRGLHTNLLVELVQEDRVAGWAHVERGPVTVNGALFGTRAVHYPDKTTRGEEHVLGGSFDGTYSLAGGVALGISLEATHSLRRDAILDGRVAPDGIRAFATVSFTHSIAAWRAPPPTPAAPPAVGEPPTEPPPAAPATGDPYDPYGPAPAEPTPTDPALAPSGSE
ncbi:MAG: hypothetical protein M3680_09870 [Myxococcota bacterium]|nr:hypothetical protein [Myxococcota bacterium]